MAEDILKRKVKKGETLWSIAQELNIPESQRTSELWKSWGYTGEPTKLPEGYELNIPQNLTKQIQNSSTQQTNSASSINSVNFSTPTTSLTPPSTNVFDITQLSKEDLKRASASFLETTQDILSKLKSASSLLKPEDIIPTQEELEKQKGLSLQEIQKTYETTKEDIQQQAEWARQELQRYGEKIGLQPALIKESIDKYNTSIEKLNYNVSKQLENLDKEYNRAVGQMNLDYANQIRQAKLDLYNFYTKTLQDQYDIITKSFNNILDIYKLQKSEEQSDLEQAQKNLKTYLDFYKGKGISFNSLPVDVQSNLMDISEKTKIPIETIKQIIETPELDTDVSTHFDSDTGKYFTILYDKKTGKILSTSSTQITTGSGLETEGIDYAWNSYINGDFNKLDSKSKQRVLKYEQQAMKDPINREIINARKEIEKRVINPPTDNENKDNLDIAIAGNDYNTARKVILDNTLNKIMNNQQLALTIYGEKKKASYPSSYFVKNKDIIAQVIKEEIEPLIEYYFPDVYFNNLKIGKEYFTYFSLFQ